MRPNPQFPVVSTDSQSPGIARTTTNPLSATSDVQSFYKSDQCISPSLFSSKEVQSLVASDVQLMFSLRPGIFLSIFRDLLEMVYFLERQCHRVKGDKPCLYFPEELRAP